MALTFDISMSLDGFVTGPRPRAGEPLGEDDGRLHDWMIPYADFHQAHDSGGNVDAAVLDRVHERVGALVMGRSMFDVGEEPWGPNPPFGLPVFVVTHRPRATAPMAGGTTYEFIVDGIDTALDRAREAADGRDVGIQGGANLITQYLAAGLVDDFQIHWVPVLLGGGTRLFEPSAGIARGDLELLRGTPSPSGVVHVEYRVKK
jgi:dihydrofolate reductase